MIRRVGIAALALGGAVLLGWGLWIPAKAALAQTLIAAEWHRALAAGTPPGAPWPGADFTPLAHLAVTFGDGRRAEWVVLNDAGGRALAFGPGHVAGSAPPGGPGVSVLGGHRDTHFRALAAARIGNTIAVTNADGSVTRFRVVAARVVDARTTAIDATAASGPRLMLVTCFPFDAAVPGGPLRWVVVADAAA